MYPRGHGIYYLGLLVVGAISWCIFDIRRLRRYGKKLHYEDRRASYILIGCQAIVAIAAATILVLYILFIEHY